MKKPDVIGINISGSVTRRMTDKEKEVIKKLEEGIPTLSELEKLEIELGIGQ